MSPLLASAIIWLPSFRSTPQSIGSEDYAFNYGMTTKNPQVFEETCQKLWQAWQSTAPERMESFVKADQDRDCLDAIARYLWNRALCEALTPSLHTFEVAVRNAVHGSLTKEYKQEDWYDLPHLLQGNERLRIADAKQYIEERDKEVTPGRVVAELTLGFWTALFSSPYESSIVHPVLGRGMTRIPSEQKKRGRHYVAERLKKARDLRNRVFHHEAIYHFHDLTHEHQMLCTFSSWLYPHFTMICGEHDRFMQVYADGLTPYRTTVTKIARAYAAKESSRK